MRWRRAFPRLLLYCPVRVNSTTTDKSWQIGQAKFLDTHYQSWCWLAVLQAVHSFSGTSGNCRAVSFGSGTYSDLNISLCLREWVIANLILNALFDLRLFRSFRSLFLFGTSKSSIPCRIWTNVSRNYGSRKRRDFLGR